MTDSDRGLLGRWCASRDADAFQELVVRHTGMVFNTCARVLGNASDAEDATQECFLELARAGGCVRETVGGWLHGVAVRKSLTLRRSERRRMNRERALSSEKSSVRQWSDVLPYVDEAVAELPLSLREPIVLRFFENQKHEEIAGRLRVSEGTVRYRIGKGLERLRASLHRRGIVAGAASLGGALAAHGAEAAVPSSLMLSIGKHVLAQAGAPGTAAGATIGGVAAMSKLAVAAIVFLAAVAALSFALPAKEPATAPAMQRVVPAAMPEVPAPEIVQVAQAEEASDAPATELPEAPAVEAADPAASTGRISGKVVHAKTGEPVPGYKMRVQRYLGVSPYGNFVFLGWVTTDAEGRFGIDAPEATHYWFLATESPLAPVDTKECGVELKTVGEVKDDVVIRVAEGAVLEGRVYDADTGKGIAGAHVIWGGGRLKTETDSNGHYRIEGLEAGHMPFGLGNVDDYINDAMIGVSERPVQFEPGETALLDFPLRKGVRARGRVVDTDGRPIAKAWVSLMPDSFGGDEEPDTYAHTETDAEGRFALPAQPGGEERNFSISAPREPDSERGYLGYSERLDAANWQSERTFILEEASDIQGTVKDTKTGLPIAKFELALTGAEQRGLDVQTLNQLKPFSDPEGRFHLKNIGPGRRALFVRAEGYGVTREVVAVDRAGETIQVDVALPASCVVEGTVRDAEGTPLPKAGIFMEELPPDWNWGEDYAPIRADAGGHFRIDSLGPGKHTLHALKDGFFPASQEVTLDEGASQQVDFVVSEGGVVTGTVRLDGAPVRAASINAFVANRNEYVPTEEDGSYRLSGLPDAAVSISAHVPGGVPEYQEREVEAVEGVETLADFDFSSTAPAETEGE